MENNKPEWNEHITPKHQHPKDLEQARQRCEAEGLDSSAFDNKGPIVIGVSGKKQAGKSSLCDFLHAHHYCTRYPEGKVIAYDNGDVVVEGIGDKEEDYHDDCQTYSFADPLKQFCIDNLGLSNAQCYGTDDDKNSLTKYEWCHLPPEIKERYSPDNEYMTARQVMQVFGTDVMRDFFSDTIWVDGALAMKDNKFIAFIADVRFESEVHSLMSLPNSYMIRLDRQVADDCHSSETALDDFDFTQFGDRVLHIDNQDMTIHEKNKIALSFFNTLVS